MAARIFPKQEPRLYLAEWREHLGLTQEQLGERLGVSGVTVGRWESWRKAKGRRPDIGTLAAIAEAMGIELRDLHRHPDKPSADDLLRDQPSEIVEQALKLIRAIRI